MKRYTCDVCKKTIGYNVGFTSIVMPSYKPSDFLVDGGFYYHNRPDADLCTDCSNSIAQAQQEAIEKLTPKT